jgi:hypothetical protein
VRAGRELGVSDTLIMVRKLVAEGKVRISEHGYDELADDNIFAIDVLDGVDAADAVEDYPQRPIDRTLGDGRTTL